jgi:rhodanese-related sulfurtransferase
MEQRIRRPGRRTLLISGLAAGVAALGASVLLPEGFEGAVMAPPDAHAAARAGTLILIDIRRPDEWALTGIGEGAHPLDMRDDGFAAEVLRLVGQDLTRPVALICARGVRSSRMAARLTRAGHTRIIDVSEGMLGSAAGPGWIARGLPVRPG